ncbi:MAG TPA: glycosyltransferase family 2 protein, partial [Longimicrobiales bacterium]|nr:glycosyltransferase family 2 protein [Longimicrobiales bacterium]
MIYFCIPAYNEERTVGVVLWKLRQVMGELRRDYQIIVVDDASTDSTPSVLNPYIRVLPLTVLRNPVRRGYADSMEIAIREALHRAPYPKRDLIITLQADFTEDPDVAPAMIKLIEAGADVVGTEVQVEAAATRKFRWGRKLFRWLLRGKQWATVGDPLSSLRAYRVMVLKRALEARPNGRLLTWRGWGANAELLAQALPHSRRNEVVESTLLMNRHQRDSRFSLSHEMSEARGAATGKPSKNATALPLDAKVVTPQAVVAESKHRRYERNDRHERGERPQRGQRRDRKPRGEKQERPERSARPPRPERPARAERPAAIVPPSSEEAAPRKKRRPRRRKKRGAQSTPNVETSSVEHVSTESMEPRALPSVE